MVVIDYPDNTCHKFFLREGTFFGPLDENGDYRASQIELSLQGETFLPERGIYGENNIVHASFNGKVFYYPIMADCVPAPSSTYPRRLYVPVKEQTLPVDCVHGFGCPNIGARVLYSSNSQCACQTVLRDTTGRTYTLIRVIGVNASSNRCYVYVWTWTFNSWKSATEAYFTQTYKYSPSTVPWTFGWTHCPGHKQIMDTMESVTKWSSLSTGITSNKVWTTDPSAVKKPRDLQSGLDTFANELMNENFAIDEIDYGVLAARAIKQKKLINTNIYEFLKDLPDIKGLIPKLENLNRLKTHASNYLAYEYGVLPTISDVKAIVAAFKVRVPFVDKNGFTILNSSESRTEVVNNTIYCLTQYAKVAVANEDSEFIHLMNQMDEYGVGLTYENLWDVTKFSFVIDWFINVGGFLRRIDQNQRLLRYNIPYVTLSRKKSITGEINPDSGLVTLGPVEWRYYHRWVTSHCPLPPLTLSTSPTVTSHWLEAGSLIIQRAN